MSRVAFLIGIVCCVGNQDVLLSQDCDPVIATAVSTKSSREAGIALHHLYDDHRTSALITAESHTVAIYAAWRFFPRILPERTHYFGISPIVRHDPDIQRFSGFLEGRLRVGVPIWWEEMLESPDQLHAHRQGRKTASLLVFEQPLSEVSGAQVSCKCGDRSVSVPVLTLRWLAELSHVGDLYAEVCDTHIVVLNYNEFIEDEGKGRIACVSQTDRTEIWRNSIWGTGPGVRERFGPPTERINLVSIDISGAHVTVFGAHSDRRDHNSGHVYLNTEFFVEQFSRVAGQETVRFSTNSWGVRWDQED